jgi:hypothetical protein
VFVRIVDIGGIVDHHCLEVFVHFVDIGGIGVCLMVFNTIFNNISVVSWRSVL